MEDIDTKLLEAIMPRFRTSQVVEGEQWWKSARRRISSSIGTSRKKRLTVE
jgi:hypothetical protein